MQNTACFSGNILNSIGIHHNGLLKGLFETYLSVLQLSEAKLMIYVNPCFGWIFKIF